MKFCLSVFLSGMVSRQLFRTGRTYLTALPTSPIAGLCWIAPKSKWQCATYFHYKHRNTLKSLVGVAPNGFVTFASALDPGSCSDKEIVKASKVLDQMEPGDLVLADKGFLIQDIMPQGVSLNLPPFLTTPQFTIAQAKLTTKIARARIHVERGIQRIKVFNILNFIPHQYRSCATKIFQVCAAFTNLQGPFLKEVGGDLQESAEVQPLPPVYEPMTSACSLPVSHVTTAAPAQPVCSAASSANLPSRSGVLDSAALSRLASAIGVLARQDAASPESSSIVPASATPAKLVSARPTSVRTVSASSAAAGVVPVSASTTSTVRVPVSTMLASSPAVSSGVTAAGFHGCLSCGVNDHRILRTCRHCGDAYHHMCQNEDEDGKLCNFCFAHK